MMKKRKVSSKLSFNKEKISNLNMGVVRGGRVPTWEEGTSKTYDTFDPKDATDGNCQEVCAQQGTHGLCTDELNGC